MIPIEELEDANFQEILERAKNRIDQIYPAWTNYNLSDSGIVLLELLAYMIELQQFHIGQIGEAHLQAFLHLLGMCKKGMCPSKVYAKISGVKEEFFMSRGTKALAGSVVFEAEETAYIEKDDMLVEEIRPTWYPFGEEPESGAEYEICLKHPLKEKIVHTLYFDLFDQYPVSRNMIDEEFIPLVKLKLDYHNGTNYQICEILKDTTCGLLQSGILKFRFAGRMEEMDSNCRLRLTAIGEYDTAPLLKGISFNMISFVQKNTIFEYQESEFFPGEKDFYEITAKSWNVLHGDTRIYIRTEKGYKQTKKFAFYDREEMRTFVFAKEIFEGLPEKTTIRLVSGSPDRKIGAFIYKGTGMPDQQFFLPDRNVLGLSFALWVEEDKNRGYYIPWFRVSDFAKAGHMDRCYVLEEEKGVLRFGNGRQGMMPKGNIEIISYAVSAGGGGNIQKNQMSGFDRERRAIALFNPEDAAGGENTESIDACFERYKKEMEMENRAVTYKDYEEIIKRTPGLRIKKVKVFASDVLENTLEVVIQPFTNHRRILKDDIYDKNVMHFLEKRKMLGTRIIIKKTEYIGVSIRLEVRVKSRYVDAGTRIEEHVRGYFEEQMDFGKPIIYSRVFGFIDSLPETVGIHDLAIHAGGRNVMRDDNKDIYLPFNGMAYLEEIKIQCIRTNE